MLKYLFLFLFIGTAFAQKLTLDDRRSKIIGIVDEELAEVSRLARQQDYRDPNILLRISELNLEKARLWREQENEKFLSIPPEERKGADKEEFFKRSTKFFNEANTAAYKIVQKHPNYKGLGEVYYILAYNNKELGNHDEAQKYFKLASSKKGGDKKLTAKSGLALADYYFNDKNYKAAVPLYETSIGSVNDKWWTKDSFNLAWSYYRTQRYDKAINLMLEVHRKSEDPKYIDMRHQVERDIGIFYVDAGRIKDAVKFYESRGINYTEQFVKIANQIISQGRFSQAESLLDDAAKMEKDREKKIAIYIAQLDLFDKYNKIPQHLEVSKTLVKLNKESPIGEDDYKRLSYHVNKKAAELQKATASDTYKNVPKVKEQKSREAIEYFELAQQLNPAEKADKMFFQAETAYAANHFGKALGFYVKSFDAAFANNQKKLLSQNLEGMLSALGQPGLDSETAEKYYLPVYSRYISVDTKSERAKSIFVKLFNAQYEKGNIDDAEDTMEKFASNFPKDFETQEAMLAKVMEHYRKKKDYAKVKEYVADINSGKYKVSKKYADALRGLMTRIQIEGVQQSLEKGDKSTALKGYHQIFNDSESTPKAKTNAAYNLAALYYEMGDTNQSYQWGITAAKDMEAADVAKFADSFLSISGGLFLRQNFSQSADLSYRVFAKLCKQSSNNKVVAYKNAVFITLSNNELDKAIEIRNFGRQCNLPPAIVADVTLELMKDVAKAGRWETYETMLKELEADPKTHPALIRPMEELRKEHLKVGNTSEAKEIEQKQNRYFEDARTKKIEVPVEGLDLMADRIMVRVRNLKTQEGEIALRFPENEFNNAVKAKLKILDQLTNEVTVIQKLGSGKGIVEGYRLMIEAYESFGEELKAFTPEGKSPEYVTSFKKAMGDVYNPILTNAKKHRSDVKKLIMENKILSASNYAVLYGRMEGFKRFVTSKSVILMDRGGQR